MPNSAWGGFLKGHSGEDLGIAVLVITAEGTAAFAGASDEYFDHWGDQTLESCGQIDLQMTPDPSMGP
eukprot:147060-Amphidinium_carterae.1